MDSMTKRLFSTSIFSFSRGWDLIALPSEGVLSCGLKIYLVESKVGAIVCMLLALFFLGTWPAIMTLLERRGRLPQHTYLDCSITNLLAALLIAFTFGEIDKSIPDNPSFIPQLYQDNWPSVLFAMAGGVVLSIGNLSTQYAWALVGLSVVAVVGASVTVVIGATLNYFLDNKINRVEILFPGVGCFLIAVFLGSAVPASNIADDKAKLNNMSSDYKDGAVATSISTVKEINGVKSMGLESGGGSLDKVKAGTAIFLIELEKKRAIKVFGKSIFMGLAITLFAGLCFSLFSPAFNLATHDQWHTMKKGVPHLSLVDWDGRGWAFLAGLLCGFGNGLQFMGGQAAGYAAADAGQALPLVSTFWGIVLFGEFRRSSQRTFILLGSMLFMFIVAVVVLMASSGERK